MQNELIWMVFAEHLVALFTIPLLLWIGYRLFVIGVTGQMTITGTMKNNWSIKLTQVAPGTFCFLLGASLAVSSLYNIGVHAKIGDVNNDATSSLPPAQPAAPEPSATTKAPPAPVKPSESAMVSMLNGSANQSLSLRIRYALSDMVICKASLKPTDDPAACESKYYSIFTHIPKQSDMQRIEQEERESAAGNGTASKALTDEATAIEAHS